MTSFRLVVDSSVWVSDFAKTEANSAESREFFAALRSGLEILVPAIVAVEVAVSLKRDLNLIKEIFSQFSFLDLNREVAFDLLDLLKDGTSLKTSDFIVAALTKSNGAVLITWDKRLLENKICEAMTPTAFLAQSLKPKS